MAFQHERFRSFFFSITNKSQQKVRENSQETSTENKKERIEGRESCLEVNSCFGTAQHSPPRISEESKKKKKKRRNTGFQSLLLQSKRNKKKRRRRRRRRENMVAEAELVCQQSVAVLDVKYFPNKGSSVLEIDDAASAVSPPSFDRVRESESVTAELLTSQEDIRSADRISDAVLESAVLQFVPCLRSGSFADIGPRRYMEDEHIRIDDLSSHLGSLYNFPKPSAFYGVFDGHGGPEAAAYVRKNVIKFFFEDVSFPQTSEVDNVFLEEVENSLRKAFLLADSALADDCSVNSSSGTTALTALIFGRLLMVANAGDCRAVLCRKGEAIDMSQDHRPIYPSERRRVEQLGGYIDDGYLNGVLSVTRALGDWDLKLPKGSPSPLIAEPEFRQVVLTEDDEFLIIGCDGIWDVMSSQHAVSLVRRGLRRHDDPEQCARDLVMEALRLNTFDNLTVIIVCFSSIDQSEPSPSPPRHRKLRCCSLSAEALCSLRSLLEGSASN